MTKRCRKATNFFGEIMFHGGVSDGMFNTIMYQRIQPTVQNVQTVQTVQTAQTERRVKINRPQFLHEMPKKFMRGPNVS